jgi:hypothetical protein
MPPQPDRGGAASARKAHQPHVKLHVFTSGNLTTLPIGSRFGICRALQQQPAPGARVPPDTIYRLIDCHRPRLAVVYIKWYAQTGPP